MMRPGSILKHPQRKEAHSPEMVKPERRACADVRVGKPLAAVWS